MGARGDASAAGLRQAWLERASPRCRKLTAGFAVVLTIAGVGACAKSYRKGRADLPADERGVAEISRMILDYKEALTSRQFDKARGVLESLEREVKNADGVTRSHPDFEDVERTSRRARPALEAAIRRAAIDDLLAETQADIATGDGWQDALLKKGPSPATVDGLSKVNEHLAYLLGQGRQYRDDKKYAEAAVRFDEKAAHFKETAVEYGWLLKLSTALGATVKEAVAADADSLVETAALSARIDAAKRAEAGFAACKRVTAELRPEPGYNAKLRAATPLGAMSLDETELSCGFRRAAAEQRVAELSWQAELKAMVERVGSALATITPNQDPATRLKAIETTMGALVECRNLLVHVEGRPGFNAKLQLDTPHGKLSATKIRDWCNDESERLGKQNPTLHWRVALAKVEQRAKEANLATRAARSQAQADERTKALGAALGGYTECVEQAEFLDKRQLSEWKNALPSARELSALERLLSTCRRQQTKVDKLLERARRAPEGSTEPVAKGKPKKRGR